MKRLLFGVGDCVRNPRYVMCIDNTLQRDVLEVGRMYEVIGEEEKDGYYILSGLGRFSKARFAPVAEATP